MIHILFAFSLSLAASTGRFPLVRSCGDLLRTSVRGLDAIDRLESVGGEEGTARLLWPTPVIHGNDVGALYDSAKAVGVRLTTEGYHGYLGQVIGVYQASGKGRVVAQFLKDLILMKGRELDFSQWLPDEPAPKEFDWQEADFRAKLKGKAQAEFRFAYEWDEEEAGRTLAVMRLWPSTFFSSRFVYLRLEREVPVTKLAATTFVAALQEWRGGPAWVEIDGEVFLFGDSDLLWDLREVRKAQLDRWEIGLKIDPRPYLE